MAKKRTLEGFGTPGKIGDGNLLNTLKKIGPMLGTKGVRPVGGNVQGVTSAGRGNAGDVRMVPVGGKGVTSSGGKGPKSMPDFETGVKTKDLGAMTKSGLGKRDVREQA